MRQRIWSKVTIVGAVGALLFTAGLCGDRGRPRRCHGRTTVFLRAWRRRSCAVKDRTSVGGADDEGGGGRRAALTVFGTLRHYLGRKCSCLFDAFMIANVLEGRSPRSSVAIGANVVSKQREGSLPYVRP